MLPKTEVTMSAHSLTNFQYFSCKEPVNAEGLSRYKVCILIEGLLPITMLHCQGPVEKNEEFPFSLKIQIVHHLCLWQSH